MPKVVTNKHVVFAADGKVECKPPYRKEMVNGRLACVSPDNAYVVDMQTGKPMTTKATTGNNEWNSPAGLFDPTMMPFGNYSYIGYPYPYPFPGGGGGHHHHHVDGAEKATTTIVTDTKKDNPVLMVLVALGFAAGILYLAKSITK